LEKICKWLKYIWTNFIYGVYYGPIETQIGAIMFEHITYRVIHTNEFGSRGSGNKTGRENAIRPLEGIGEMTFETDQEIIDRMRSRFSVLDDMTKAVKKGHVRSMIVSGPPGVGKSFGVEQVLGKNKLLADLASDESLKKYDIVKGSMTALGLYAKLYQYRHDRNVLVFDDCDSLFFDIISMNLLKAALDSSKTRRINWLADSNMLRKEDIPNSFDFNGGIIFITNLDFERVSPKLKPHVEALESRCHYLDLTIKTEREKMLRIKQIIMDGMLDDLSLTEDQKTDIIRYIDANKTKLRELSLRTVLKTAGLVASFPDRWQTMAEMTMIR